MIPALIQWQIQYSISNDMEGRFRKISVTEQRSIAGGCILCALRELAVWMIEVIDKFMACYPIHGKNETWSVENANDSIQYRK